MPRENTCRFCGATLLTPAPVEGRLQPLVTPRQVGEVVTCGRLACVHAALEQEGGTP
jgi:hypothetical protein